MAKAIARVFELMCWLVCPATGRQWASGVLITDKEEPGAVPGSLRAERRQKRRRRRALWLASVGIDAGPRRIHGVRVVAAR